MKDIIEVRIMKIYALAVILAVNLALQPISYGADISGSVYYQRSATKIIYAVKIYNFGSPVFLLNSTNQRERGEKCLNREARYFIWE